MGGGHSRTHTIIQQVDNPQLTQQINNLKNQLNNQQITIEDYRKKTEELTNLTYQQQIKNNDLIKKYDLDMNKKLKELKDLKEEVDKLDLNNISELNEKEYQRFKKILKLCSQLPSYPIKGKNIAFFGPTGVGKSSLINACVGEDVCEVGDCETTQEIKPYKNKLSDVCYWDIPGKTDEINYFNATFIGLLKSMSFIGIVVNRSYTQCSQLMALLNELKIPFYIIVNKCDDLEDFEGFKKKLKINFDELNKKYENTGKSKLFFENNNIPIYISTKKKKMFDFKFLISDILTNLKPKHENMNQNEKNQDFSLEYENDVFTNFDNIVKKKKIILNEKNVFDEFDFIVNKLKNKK
jgi:GTP-binding protein EngB required for normal cell division